MGTAKRTGKKIVKKKQGASATASNAAETKPREAAASLDHRASSDRRGASERRKHDEPVAVERRVLQRRVKVNRRRQIDPTTCERDYTPEEIEFMSALDDYKRTSGRMFPTCSEVLEVLKNLGYVKSPPPAAPLTPECQPASELVSVASTI